jgi:hypothetical protein
VVREVQCRDDDAKGYRLFNRETGRAANGIFISGSFGGELLPPGDGFTGPG